MGGPTGCRAPSPSPVDPRNPASGRADLCGRVQSATDHVVCRAEGGSKRSRGSAVHGPLTPLLEGRQAAFRIVVVQPTGVRAGPSAPWAVAGGLVALGRPLLP